MGSCEMSTGTVHLSVGGAVARVTLSNPGRYNAMSLSMWQALHETILAINDRPDIRVVLLRGDGDKAFVSGADISEFEAQRSSPDSVRAHDRVVDEAETALRDCAKPVVACIHGVCMGGGMAVALSCDLRYCARNARFRMPAARLGLGYPGDAMRRMVDAIGAARVAEVFYTARTFDGIEAERIGLVHSAHGEAELDDAVEHIVSAIAENAPLTIRAAKLAIRHSVGDPNGQESDSVERAIRLCSESSDYAEGRRAFMEKRTPRFTGA